MGQRIELAPYIEKASDLLADIVITSIQKSLRVEKTLPDIVVFPVGGANFFLKAISDAFPRLKNVVPREYFFQCHWLLVDGYCGMSDIRIVVVLTEANPELVAYFEKISPRARAERTRVLATLGQQLGNQRRAAGENLIPPLRQAPVMPL